MKGNTHPIHLVSCADLPTIANGMITYSPSTSPRLEGAEATYSCVANYAMVGVDTRICGSEGEWNGVEPVCIGKF